MAVEALVHEASPLIESIVGEGTLESRRDRIQLGGTFVDHVDRRAAVERIRQFLHSGAPHQIVTVNLDFLAIASRDASFQQTINEADLAVPDGMPLVWLSRLKGHALVERVTGVDLVEESCRLATAAEVGVFLLGAAPGVADRAAQRLAERHPGLRIVGTHSPPIGHLTSAENARIVRRVREAAPGFLFVALGAPRQDVWIREHLSQLDVPACMGVGCVLDLLAGSASRAPRWMQGSGLEWAYRLAREPGRLWRRYLLEDIPTLARLAISSSRKDVEPLPVPT